MGYFLTKNMILVKIILLMCLIFISTLFIPVKMAKKTVKNKEGFLCEVTSVTDFQWILVGDGIYMRGISFMFYAQ